MFSNHPVLIEIRSRILRGEMARGSPIKVTDLAEALIVSAAPVRDALLRLSERGLVVHVDGKGFFVASPSPTICTDLSAVLQQMFEIGASHRIFRRPDCDLTDWNDRLLANVVCSVCIPELRRTASALSDQITLALAVTDRSSQIATERKATKHMMRLLEEGQFARAVRFSRRVHRWLLADLRRELGR